MGNERSITDRLYSREVGIARKAMGEVVAAWRAAENAEQARGPEDEILRRWRVAKEKRRLVEDLLSRRALPRRVAVRMPGVDERAIIEELDRLSWILPVLGSRERD